MVGEEICGVVVSVKYGVFNETHCHLIHCESHHRYLFNKFFVFFYTGGQTLRLEQKV